ncbi:MAG: hypothetical protein ACFE9S_03690 [Candidatus Hermodarchaeota archaeon]
MGINNNYKRGIFLSFLLLIFTAGVFLINTGEKNYLIDENEFCLSAPEDNYEPNDHILSAWDLINYENRWLSSINGTGTQWNDDYYRIWVDYGSLYLKINLTFSDNLNNMNLTLYDNGYIEVTQSDTDTDNEYIEIFYPSDGFYYIQVDGNNSGDIYDLWWQTDDLYEDNDDFGNSKYVDTGYYSNLKIVGGDVDWFRTYLNPGDIIEVYIYFNDLQGNLQLELYDPFNGYRFGSYTYNNYEHISYTADMSGEWHFLIYHEYANSSVQYDLDIWLNTGDDWMENNDDFWSAWPVVPNYYGGLTIKEYDEDWFYLYLSPGDEIEVSIKNFDNNIGNLELELYNPSYEKKAESYLSSTEEYIRFYLRHAEEPGDWRIRVFRVSGNSYDHVYYDLDIWVNKGREDPYEWNDFPEEAYYLGDDEQTWLSEIHGNAVQGSEDWYLIFITPGFMHLKINVEYNYTEGNIDIELYSFWWEYNYMHRTLIEGNYTSFDNTHLELNVTEPGPYLIRIFGDFMGNEYDLWWDDIRTDFRSDDNYEDNDNPLNAYDLTFFSHRDEYGIWGTPLRHINDIGIQSDNDWYKIYVAVGTEFLVLRVEVFYEYSAGPVGIELYDSGLSRLSGNFSMEDNEFLKYVLPSNGTYYLRIYGDNSGSPYDLRWSLQEDYNELIPGYDIFIVLGMIIGVTTVISLKWKRSKRNY